MNENKFNFSEPKSFEQKVDEMATQMVFDFKQYRGEKLSMSGYLGQLQSQFPGSAEMRSAGVATISSAEYLRALKEIGDKVRSKIILEDPSDGDLIFYNLYLKQIEKAVNERLKIFGSHSKVEVEPIYNPILDTGPER